MSEDTDYTHIPMKIVGVIRGPIVASGGYVATEADKLRAEVERMRDALIKIRADDGRDISLREIARDALMGKP